MIIDWDIHRWETELAIESLAKYLDIIENQFENVRQQEQKSSIQNPPAGLSELEFVEWQSEIQFFKNQYERDFPSKIRYSFIVLLYIVLENHLRAACDEISKRRSLELNESDLKGAPIERSKLFLKKVAKLPSVNPGVDQWLSDFQKVRNCIVHTNGQIEKCKDKVKKRLNELCNKSIGLSADAGILIIEPYYCTKTLKMIKSFFGYLFDSAGFGKPMM